MWFQVELPAPAAITEVQFNSGSGGRGGGGRGGPAGPGGRGGRAGAAPAAGGEGPVAPLPPPIVGYPRGFRVQTSMDGATWTSVAEGQGSSATTNITFAPVRARFVRLTTTAADPALWSIQNFRLYQQQGR